MHYSITRTSLFVLFLIVLTPVFAEQLSYNLGECYEHAVKIAPSVTLQKEILTQNNAQIHESFSQFFPALNLNGSYQKQEAVSNSLLKNIYPSEQENYAINISQSVFNGFKDYAQYKIKNEEKIAQEYNLTIAKKQLYLQIIPIFYSILSNESVLMNYQEELLLDKKREKEIIEFQRFAKVKKTDLLSIESDIANLEVEMENTKEQIEINRHLLNTITRLDTNSKYIDNFVVEDIKPLEFYLNSIEKRSEIFIGKSQIEIASQQIEQAKGNYLPSLAVSGNYYLKRPDHLSEVHWDIQLNATLSLFSGGQTQAQVAEFVAVKAQKTEQLEDAKNQAEQEIKTLYTNVLYDKKQIEKLTQLVTLDEKTAQAIYNDYKNGLASVSDFLQYSKNYQRAKRNLEQAKYTEKVDLLKLKLATYLLEF